MWLNFNSVAQQLPDVHPGALPRLQELIIQLTSQREPLVLPASWGAAPNVFPALRRLTLEAEIALPLPAWARGFTQLETLTIAGGTIGQVAGTSAAVVVPAAAAPANELPVEWARGFPRLSELVLQLLNLTGTFPAAWQASGSFPALQTL